MVNCPVCGMHVNYVFLRTEKPRCELGHELGTWVHCQNKSEKHVYLLAKEEKCPLCGSVEWRAMKEGLKVSCLHVTDDGRKCGTRPFVWIKEGPPCFMNHVDGMKVVE